MMKLILPFPLRLVGCLNKYRIIFKSCLMNAEQHVCSFIEMNFITEAVSREDNPWWP
ncbi:hypothetical protein SAMN02745166_03462 [Prosthecobacter debontii]|uniref:Uncharacterized protein n=1 Tax=Prosthecobacter debontii TaxID=48467 RepID=A0A1T4YJ33_9BACT|nr:hypothetical protein SAMN02745166_03462 [Prosthecobacter debontii]